MTGPGLASNSREILAQATGSAALVVKYSQMRVRRKWTDLLILLTFVCMVAVAARTRSHKPLAESSAPSPLAIAANAYRQGQYEKCIALCAAQLENEPGDLSYMRYVGMCQRRLGLKREALKTFNAALDSVDEKSTFTAAFFYNRLSLLHLERAKLQVELNEPNRLQEDLSAFDRLSSYENASIEARGEYTVLQAIAKYPQDEKAAIRELNSIQDASPALPEAQLHLKAIEAKRAGSRVTPCLLPGCYICQGPLPSAQPKISSPYTPPPADMPSDI